MAIVKAYCMKAQHGVDINRAMLCGAFLVKENTNRAIRTCGTCFYSRSLNSDGTLTNSIREEIISRNKLKDKAGVGC